MERNNGSNTHPRRSLAALERVGQPDANLLESNRAVAKKLTVERVNAQRIETMLHVGTHIDAPLHFVSDGKDVASLPLERLYGLAVVVDTSDTVGDYDIYTPQHMLGR